MIKSSVLVFLIIFPSALKSQMIKGKIIDEETATALAYVNIGIPELGIGTVSDQNGNFELNVKGGKADSVLFSAIGYTSKKYALSFLLENQEIKLSPKSYQLKSFEIVKKASGRDKIYGKEKGFPQGANSLRNQPGNEIGTPIKIRKPTYLKSANFTIARTSGDSMIYRVNIYEFNDGKVGENLLTENVLLSGVQKEGVVSLDLTPHELVVEHDVLLALENIKVDGTKDYMGILFRYTSIFLRDRNVYGRIGENSKNVGGEFTKLIDGVMLNFFFVGRKL
jgi:hypothetical protein